jgi:hypothetical protein
MVAKRAQSAWLAALMLGVVAGIFGLIMPVTGMALAVVTTALVLLVPGPRLFGLAGAWLGFGGIWSGLLIRVGIDCVVGPSTSDGCDNWLFIAHLVVGILMAIAGLLLTLVVFRGRRES